MKFLQGPKGTLVLFDYTVSLLAIIGNCLVLESVVKLHFDLTGYRRFLISLAVSDLYICGVNLLGFIHATVAMYSTNPQMEKCGADFLRSLQFVGFFANLLNLCGMSVDHFVGIICPLRYCDLMSKKVTRIAVIAIWIISFALGFADFPIATVFYLTSHYEPAASPFTSAGIDSSTSTLLKHLSSMGSSQDIPNLLNGTLNIPDDLLNVAKVKNVKDFDSGNSYDEETALPTDDLSLLSSPFMEQFSGISSDDLLTNFDRKIGSGSGAGTEESLEKALYEEILRHLKQIPQRTEDVDWCTFYLSNKVWLEFSVMTLTLACFIFLIICYGRIFREVFVNIDPAERNTRKLVVTTFLLLGAFTVCWLPFMVFEFSMIIVLRIDPDANNNRTLADSASFLIIHNIFNSLLMCYPLLDPIIYAARMRIVRRHILNKYRRFFPCCSEYIESISSARRSSVMSMLKYNNVFISSNASGSLLNNGRRATAGPTSANTGNRRMVARLAQQNSGFSISKRSSVAVSNLSEVTESCWQQIDQVESSIEELPQSIQCPPLIYRHGTSFRRQLHKVMVKSSQEQQQSVKSENPIREMIAKKLSSCKKTEELQPLIPKYHFRSRSSYQILMCTEPAIMTPSNASAAGASTASSSVRSYGSGDSSTLRSQHDEDDDSDSLSSSGVASYAHYCGTLQKPQCPCSEFANSQAVFDRFRDNSLRLFGAGTLGPDPSMSSCNSCAEDNNDSTSVEPNVPKARNSFVKTPTFGDFSSPGEIFEKHRKSNCQQ